MIAESEAGTNDRPIYESSTSRVLTSIKSRSAIERDKLYFNLRNAFEFKYQNEIAKIFGLSYIWCVEAEARSACFNAYKFIITEENSAQERVQQEQVNTIDGSKNKAKLVKKWLFKKIGEFDESTAAERRAIYARENARLFPPPKIKQKNNQTDKITRKLKVDL
jgi:hypothetical protein